MKFKKSECPYDSENSCPLNHHFREFSFPLFEVERRMM